MYSLPFASRTTAPSPSTMTSSWSATVCMSAKGCQNLLMGGDGTSAAARGTATPRAGTRRPCRHGATVGRAPDVDRARIDRGGKLVAGGQAGEANAGGEPAELPLRLLPAEIREAAGDGQAHPLRPPS